MSEPEAGWPPGDPRRPPGRAPDGLPSAYAAAADPASVPGGLPMQAQPAEGSPVGPYPSSPYRTGGPPQSPYAQNAFPPASTQPYDLGSSTRPYGAQDWQAAPDRGPGQDGINGSNGTNGHGGPWAAYPRSGAPYAGPPPVGDGAYANGYARANGYGGANGYDGVDAPRGENGYALLGQEPPAGWAPQEPWLGASEPTRRSAARTRRDARDDARNEVDQPRTRAESLRDRRRARRRSQSRLGSVFSGVLEVVVVLSMALTLSLLIKTFLVQAFFIPSESMQNSLLVGDRVLVSKLTPGPFALHRGDVVVFEDTQGWLGPQPTPQNGPVRQGLTDALTFVGLLPADSGQHLIKRIIGLPGDKVVCCDASGKLTVNGVSITEPYIKPGNVPSTQPFTVTVRAGELWVMGDNRGDSADSRAHLQQPGGGQVPIADVVGKAFVVVWPFDRFGGVAEPPDVFAKVPDPPASP